MDAPGYSRREQWSWYAYDWANSAFSTTVVTVFMGPYLTALAKAAGDAQGNVHPLGLTIAAGAFFPYMVSLSVLLQVMVLPVLGAVADYAQAKKQMLGLFTYLGVLATLTTCFLSGTQYLAGGLLFVFANLCFGAGVVFYNAFLPEIAAPEERDAVSSRGWGIGYLGGGVCLALNLLLLGKASALGISQGQAVRISLGSAAVWWGLFSVLPLLGLRQRRAGQTLSSRSEYLVVGFHQLWHTLRELKRYPQTLLFLVAYLVYNDAIQTVIALASQFGSEALHLPLSVLTGAILMVQFVAFAGAMLFQYVARRISAKRAVLVTLGIWAAVLVYIYYGVYTARDFYVVCAIVGIVLGGSQALSRSIYSLMIPQGREAEYFSLYEISDKGTSWLGPLLYGLAYQLSHNYRLSIVSLVLFFAIGLLLLSRVDVGRAVAEAGNAGRLEDSPVKV